MNQNELAEKLGVSRQLISLHIKKRGAPKVDDVEGWQAFLAAEGREAGLDAKLRNQIGEQRLKYLTKQTEKLELENSVKRGESINFEIVQQFIRDLVANCFFGELERMSNEFPSALKGRNEVAIKQECDVQIEAVKERLRKRLIALTKVKP